MNDFEEPLKFHDNDVQIPISYRSIALITIYFVKFGFIGENTSQTSHFVNMSSFGEYVIISVCDKNEDSHK